ncbi:MAG: tetratricopeptide repeat protein [Candidatus Brocadiia bacterium]
MKRLSLFLSAVFTIAMLVSCNNGTPQNAQGSWIDNYLATADLSMKPPSATSTPPITVSGPFGENVEEHPDLISRVVLPQDYYSKEVLDNQLKTSYSLINKRDWKTATRELLEYLRHKPDDVEASFLLSVAFGGDGDLAREEKMLARTLELRPEHPFANYNLGCCRMARGQDVEALAAFDRALRRSPSLLGAICNKARIAMKWNMFEPAFELLSIAAGLAPEDDRILNDLGICAERTGRIDAAVAFYARALSVTPNSGEILDNYSGCLATAGMIGSAMDVISKWQEVEPKSWRPLYRLACLYCRLGNIGRAADMYTQAVAFGFADTDWAAADPDLAPLFTARPELLEVSKND